MSRVRSFIGGAATLIVVIGVIGALVVLGGKLFRGGGDDGSGSAVASLGPPESSWIPGQPGLAEYAQFRELFTRAVRLARQRQAERELELKEIERRKREAKEREDAEAKRRYEEAKRRAHEKYLKALADARERERLRKERLARKMAEYRKKLRDARKAREVPPGEECHFSNVRRNFQCRKGLLPERKK